MFLSSGFDWLSNRRCDGALSQYLAHNILRWAEKNKQVEMAAEEAVTTPYEAAGWTVTRVAHLKRGWDLTASRGGEVRHVEVKGVSSSLPSILLTRNELRTA